MQGQEQEHVFEKPRFLILFQNFGNLTVTGNIFFSHKNETPKLFLDTKSYFGAYIENIHFANKAFPHSIELFISLTNNDNDKKFLL